MIQKIVMFVRTRPYFTAFLILSNIWPAVVASRLYVATQRVSELETREEIHNVVIQECARQAMTTVYLLKLRMDGQLAQTGEMEFWDLESDDKFQCTAFGCREVSK